VSWVVSWVAGLPQPAIKIQDDARVRCAKRLELFEDALYIPEIVHQVRQNDDVKLFVELRKVMRVRLEECKLRIFLLCAADHFLREIDAHTAGRLQRSE
jgi:hypothetical protein